MKKLAILLLMLPGAAMAQPLPEPQAVALGQMVTECTGREADRLTQIVQLSRQNADLQKQLDAVKKQAADSAKPAGK